MIRVKMISAEDFKSKASEKIGNISRRYKVDIWALSYTSLFAGRRKGEFSRRCLEPVQAFLIDRQVTLASGVPEDRCAITGRPT